MNEKRIEEGRFTHHGHGLGTVTQEMVEARAKELAQLNGRTSDNVLDFDREQAYRELTGKERLVPEEGPAEQLPEEARWEEVPTSSGQRVEAVPAPDEQIFSQELVEEGVEEAEHDQMVAAARESRRRDQR
jgi:hypothetical protein